MEAVLRPKVPMYCLQGAAYVCALGAAEAIGGRVNWPFTVTDEMGAPLVTIEARGGYDEEGLFVRVMGKGLDDEMISGITARVALWEDGIAQRQGAVAGPLALLLEDYVDRLTGFGGDVEVVFPNGNIAARGTFCGVDVWGRATVRTPAGRELEIAPEQASLRLLGQA